MVRSPVFLAYCLLLGILAACFGAALWGSQRLAFRDCGHFYTPLYQHVATQERSQWLPLYNAADGAGMPLAGETTTALFYPLRRVVYQIAPSAESALAWYVVLHLLIASVTIHYAASVAGATARGCAVAILTYPLSGPILFQYCNPPFLVGAAWIPLALAAGYRLLSRPRTGDLAIAALGLAMPILGGDPQVSIHVVLIGLAAALVACLRGTAAAPGVFLRLAAALLLAILLASPQIAASMDWAQQSVRYAPPSPQRTVEVYHFSVAPWHWLELVAPALSGQLFPVYARISHLLPGDGQTWVITLYAGLIPLALTVLRYRCTAWRRLDLWDALMPAGLAFALGSFGLGYLLKALLPFAALQLDDAAGGPYWWLVTFMPGYSGFRYPAKWLVFVPLGIAIAAARQGSRWSPQDGFRLARVALALSLLSVSVSALVVVALAVTASRSPHLLSLADPLWGPLQPRAAAASVATSALVVTSLAAAAFWVCRRRLHQSALTSCLLLLLAIDLTIAAWPTIATIERAAEAEQIAAARRVHSDASLTAEPTSRTAQPSHGQPASSGRGSSSGQRAMRFASGDGWLSRWRTTPSPGSERLLAVEASLRNSLYGRWHLSEDRALFNPVTTLPPHRMQSFWRAANDLARRRPAGEQRRYWDRIMGWLAIDCGWSVVAAESGVEEQAAEQAQRSTSGLLTLRVDQTRSPAQPVRWSNTWRVIAEQSWVPPQTFARRLAEVASSADAPPLVEMDTAQPDRSDDGDTETDTISPLQRAGIMIQQASPGRWRITVDTPTSGLLCIKQFHDGNWHATTRTLASVRSASESESHGDVKFGTMNPGDVNPGDAPPGAAQPTEVYRCDYLFSAVKVPAGVSEITLRYHPRWLYPTLILAAIAWVTTLILLFIPRRLENRNGNSSFLYRPSSRDGQL